jgi:CheY-like chemotaxis protein
MAGPGETEPLGFLLCKDFIWVSRITGTAQALGLSVTPARSVEQLEKAVRQRAPACVLIDLDSPDWVVSAVVPRIQALCPHPVRFVAFGSHVDVASLRAARAAGCDPVLPRSAFAEDLAKLLPSWLTPA